MSCAQLTDFMAYRIEGEDNLTFLQGQLTNDTSKLTEAGHWSAFCDHKGQVHALFYLVKQADGSVIAIARKDGLEAIMRRLSMFVLRAKVKITPMAELAVFGCVNAHGLVSLSTQPNSTSLSQEDWLLAAFKAGVPLCAPSNPANHLAQYLNLDLVDAIDFKKGCYVGQEAIARTHYRGKTTRRMVTFALQSPVECPLNEPLDLTYGEEDEATFTPIFSTQSGTGAYLQGIISLVALEKSAGQFQLNGQALTLLEHPKFSEA